MAFQHQSVHAATLSKHRMSSNSGTRYTNSNDYALGSGNYSKDQKLQNVNKIDSISNKQVRSSHGSANSHHQAQSSYVHHKNVDSKGALAFNPVALLQSHNMQEKSNPGSSQQHNQQSHQSNRQQAYQDNSSHSGLKLTQQSHSNNSQQHSRRQTTKTYVSTQQTTVQSNTQQLHFAAHKNGRNPVDSNVAIQPQKVHHQRGKFHGSFLASHNNKAKASGIIDKQSRMGGNFSVSPAHLSHPGGVGQPILLKQNQVHPHQVKISNKSPVAVSNPSTFTISTTQNNIMFNSSSPHNVGSNGSGSKGQRQFSAVGSNPSSAKHNSTKQTVTSDILMATDQSSVNQRENIKVFSFKPGNLKVQPKQLNVASLKTSQISLSKEHAHMLVNKAKTRVPTQAHPSPTGMGQENMFSKARNRSSGSNACADPHHHKGQVLVSQRPSLKGASSTTKYHSPDGNVSNESKRPVIVMQPNIVKKPLMTNYSREDSQEAKDYHSPDQPPSGQISRRSKKKAVTQLNVQHSQPQSAVTTKRVQSAKRQNQAQQNTQPTTASIELIQSQILMKPSTNNFGAQSNVQKIKIKKRGHSENMHTDGSNQRAANTMLVVNNHTPPPAQGQKSSHNKGAKSNNFQQRGSSLMQPQTTSITEVNKKLVALKQQQDQKTSIEREQQPRQQSGQTHTPADHKEVIVNHIRKYIKVSKNPDSATGNQVTLGETKGEKTETIIQNLRDFLTYLENKNIINPQKLQDQNEMKSLIKDIMKLDLSKFSKPRNGSQPRKPQHQQTSQPDQDASNITKKRKVMPSPATHNNQPESKSVPTQFSAGTQSSQQSIANFAKMKQQLGQIEQKGNQNSRGHARTKNTSMETSPKEVKAQVVGGVKYEYASQPKYLNYGMIASHKTGIKTTGNRSRDNSGSNKSPGTAKQSITTEQKINMSSVNFVLPSNRQTDVYGVQSIQTSQLQSSQNSPSAARNQSNQYKLYKRGSFKAQNDSIQTKADSKNTSSQNDSVNRDQQIQSKEMTILTNKKRQNSNSHYQEPNQDTIAVEEQLKKFKHTAKPRLGHRDSKTAIPSTQCSPRDNHRQKLLGSSSGGGGNPATSHYKVSSQPNLSSTTANNQVPGPQLVSNGQPPQQQVPTIQLMINTNGQGKFLGINVNNYCFAAQDPSQNQEVQQSRQLQQVIQMQNNSAEQLNRAQNNVNGLSKGQKNVVKTEPDQHLYRHQNIQQETDGHKKLRLNSSNNSGKNIIKDFMKQQNVKQNSNESLRSHGEGAPQHQQPYKQNKQQSRHMHINNENGSSEFEIVDQDNQAQQYSKGTSGNRKDSLYENQRSNENSGDKNLNFLINPCQSHSKRKNSEYAMIIQDEDDDNTGGDGAEAKMSPTNMGASSNINFNASKQVQQETPIMNKLQQSQKQYSSSNRGGSGRSSQRTSSLTKAQIQVAIGPKQSHNFRPTPQDQRSKESSVERSSALQDKLIEHNQSRAAKNDKNDKNQDVPNDIASQINSEVTPAAMNSLNKEYPQKVVLNDPVTEDRDKLIRYIKAHVKKHSKIPHTTLDFYRFVKLLGKGAFGKITLGIHKLTGKYVAIKSIDKVNIKDEYSRRKVFQEVYILKKIRHSCVIRLLEVFESEKHFLMVMEYSGGGDLLQYVKKRKRLNEQSAKAIFKQVLYALGHCHCRSVLHRDIKLDNVLMDGEGGVKLCDFGVSRLIKKGHTINEQCGTPAYLAPEIILDKGYQGYTADIWSLGVLLYAMVQGTVPFKAHNIQDLHKLILKGEFEFPVDTVSDEVKDLVRKMIVLDPAKRISIPSMLNHPWVFDMQREMGSEASQFEDEEHDLRVGSTFFREEVLGGLITGYQSDGNENGNINFVNVENLYYRGGPPQKEPPTSPEEKVTYSDYCALTEDFMTYRIDEEAMEIVTGFGYPRQLVIESINRGDVNHATAAYYLLVY